MNNKILDCCTQDHISKETYNTYNSVKYEIY